MLNQNAVSVNPVRSLNLAGTPERVDFIFTRALRRLGRLYDVAYNATPREIIDAIKIDRVAFAQNSADPDAAIVVDAINLAVDALVEYIDDDDTSRKERKNIVGRLVDNILTIKGARDRRGETTEPETEPAETVKTTETTETTTEPETESETVETESEISDEETTRLWDEFTTLAEDRPALFGGILSTPPTAFYSERRAELLNADKIEGLPSPDEIKDETEKYIEDYGGDFNAAARVIAAKDTNARTAAIIAKMQDVNKKEAATMRAFVVAYAKKYADITRSQTVETSEPFVEISDEMKKEISVYRYTFESIANHPKNAERFCKGKLPDIVSDGKKDLMKYLDRNFIALKTEKTMAAFFAAMKTNAEKYRAAQENARALFEVLNDALENNLFVIAPPKGAQASQPDAAILAASTAFGAVGLYAAPLMIGEETQQDAPVVTIDDVLTDDEKALLNSIDWEKGDSIPALLLRSINQKNPIWVKPWFNYASLQRKYFDGARYSIGNMLRLMLQGANPDFYVSRTEARRILGKDAAPQQGARAYKVLKPRVWGAKNLSKNDLDALRRREYVPIEMKSDDEMNELERKHAGKIRFETESIYHQGAFKGLPLKHTEPLYRNDNERNALADKVLADFCAANNITLCIMPGVNRACCSFVIDDDDAPITITAPTIEDHKSAADYYSTLFHEALHAANRRNHCQLTKKREELSAEIGSCIVLNTLGFNSSEYIDNSAAYVKSWKDVANEKNAIVKAWKYAEKSANLILVSFFEMQRAAIKTDETQEPTTEPAETEPTTTTEPETIETVETVETENTIDDDETLRDLAEWVDQYEKDAETAYYTNGIVHADNARRSERDARAAIQEAREAGLISDARADEIEAQIDAIKRQWAPESVPTSLF